MKTISRFFLVPLAAVLLGGFLWTCSDEFLDVAPRGALGESVLATKSGVEGLLLGAYSQLGGRNNYFGGASNWANGSIQGGEANKGTNDGDFTDINELVQYQLESTSRIPRDRWNGLYEGVTRANSALALLAASQDPLITDADRTRIAAEARFLRAHYYFQLKISFNRVPWLMEGLTLEEQQVVVSSDPWPNIEADFLFAFDNLPETQAEAGRANKWAAAAYLGKTYLFQDKWGEANNMFQMVVDNGQTTNGQAYGLLDYYPDAFNAEFDNSKESVFAVQAAVNTGATQNANPDFVLNFIQNGPGGCCGFFQPSFDLVNSFRTVDGLPLLDNSQNADGNKLKHDQGIEGLDPEKPETFFTPDDGPVDPRLDHSVGRRGIPYLDWGDHPGKPYIRDQPYAGPYSPKKFVFYQAQQGSLSDGSSWTAGYGGMNYNIIRYADVLLMLAETEIELGNLEPARALINQIRERAAASPLTRADGTETANYVINTYDAAFASADEARAALRMERKLELSGEGHRFFDLRRWGIAEQELDRIIANEQQILPIAYLGADFSSPQDLYYPIPQGQIDLQGPEVLPQNPGY
ncbi:MAG: RagB/SusD family nutrient uptake outer membrane protein [Bacteroidota bacterium]